ncbi:2-C-methyl-D-erythritol 4-phosphate cytidylyltransferase [Pantoea sp. Mhis]|uniref:2-C-methyl-D-erythritol 4-phosphate cytidylyltransferase n=1 Tax=Pantoea sp. Mhis TaxID=2576759 RepID=UPI00135C71BE|nr:2-C-methyl-D-erythritol 4-phosphate cytidylyltransferase [Pantoea sp. Mhis]MXP56713.1 2-C-methyl-D-erythritol 4-phosphate cytidylyltransferase [Pantoea sp. Mhis]
MSAIPYYYYNDVIALVPAAGIGNRMQSIFPKQYLTVGKYTLLEHSITRLFSHPKIKKAVVVLSKDDVWFDKLAIAKDSRILRVTGRSTRAESVLIGLKMMEKCEWVLVHDGVRPCVHLDDLTRLLAIRSYNKIGAILAIPIHDTIKRSNPNQNTISHTIAREDLWQALTPQLFRYDLLKKCLTQALNEGAKITDEAAAIEYCGYNPILINSHRDNIKVTEPEDLAIANFYLNRFQSEELKSK